MQEKFTLDAILTVVDAQQILTRLDEQKPDGIKNEAEQQVLVCVTFFVICVILYYFIIVSIIVRF